MRTHLTRTAPAGLVLFMGSRLAIFIVAITAYSIAQPQELARPTPHTAAPRTSRPTFSAHAVNIMSQFERIAALHNTDQALLCEELTTTSCYETNTERCTAVVDACQRLNEFSNEITNAQDTVDDVFRLGCLDLDATCDGVETHGVHLTSAQAHVRDTYRTVLLARIDELGEMLRRRDNVLDLLREAVQYVSGDGALDELGIASRHECVNEALDSSLESIRAIQSIIHGDAPHRTPADPRIPPCGGDVQCWEI